MGFLLGPRDISVWTTITRNDSARASYGNALIGAGAAGFLSVSCTQGFVTMSICIGEPAPDFKAMAVVDKQFKEVSLS